MTLPTPPVQRPLAGGLPTIDIATHKPAASEALALLMPEGVSVPVARRLVVLVPDTDLDETALSRRIWTLAAPNQLAVLYVGVARSGPEETHARRWLASIAASTRYDTLPKNWAESALMLLSVVAECGLIGLWSRVSN